MSTQPTSLERDILLHTSRNGRYVTDADPTMDALVARGWLQSFGPQALAGGMTYYTMTSAGRQALRS